MEKKSENDLQSVAESPTSNVTVMSNSAEIKISSTKKSKKNLAPHPSVPDEEKSTSAEIKSSSTKKSKKNPAPHPSVPDEEKSTSAEMKSKSTKKRKKSASDAEKNTSAEMKNNSSKKTKKDLERPPSTPTMALESLKTFNLRNGVTIEAIQNQILQNYEVDKTKMKPLLKQYLKRAVEKGTLLQLSGAGGIEKFKINKMKRVKKEQKIPTGRKQKSEPQKKTVSKKQSKKTAK